ncbi:MAG: lytic transglycosylase domain-containing protein [Caulobacteraceae bacterium]|nr:lytic transglycosylase domain-containing protein [Caulobacteraceae bacterium]
MTLTKRMQIAAFAMICAAAPLSQAQAAGKGPLESVAEAAESVVNVITNPAKARAAREAYYSGELSRAAELATAAGENWIAGLALYRTGQKNQALVHFERVARDGKEDAWLRSAAGFWGARTAGELDQSDKALELTRLAAMQPRTFYGMIASRQLELARGAVKTQAAAQPRGMIVKASYMPSAPAKAAVDAVGDLLASLTPPKPLGYVPSSSGMDYPLPTLEPKWGFTIDKALVYAIVRQESRFNPLAVSPAGAVGLMQLMPAAAARAAGDDKLLKDNSPLFDPAFNLRVGQDYFTWLLERGVGYDLLQAVAAYNGGPGTLLNTVERVGEDADSLMVIESLPARETRNYVEKVVAGYWTYRKLFGQESPTLDALATGAKRVDLRLDKHA